MPASLAGVERPPARLPARSQVGGMGVGGMVVGLPETLLLPKEYTVPPLAYAMPAPLSVIVTSLRRMVAVDVVAPDGPKASTPLPPLCGTWGGSTKSVTAPDASWPERIPAQPLCRTTHGRTA